MQVGDTERVPPQCSDELFPCRSSRYPCQRFLSLRRSSSVLSGCTKILPSPYPLSLCLDASTMQQSHGHINFNRRGQGRTGFSRSQGSLLPRRMASLTRTSRPTRWWKRSLTSDLVSNVEFFSSKRLGHTYFGVKWQILPLCLTGKFYANHAFVHKGKILRQGCRCVHNDSILRHRIWSKIPL